MMRIIFWSFLLAVLTIVGGGAGVSSAAVFGQPQGSTKSSAWVKSHHTRARLISGEAQGQGQDLKLRAGIHIEIDKGWKTYWRTPGEAGGVPPFFDWSGSTNLKSARVLYPAPKRIAGEDGFSIGYKGEVVFPVDVVPLDATKPVGLILQIDYGVCKEICIPVQSKLKLMLPKSVDVVRSGTMEGQLIRRFSERVPEDIGRDDALQPKLRSIKINFDGLHPELVVEADYPAGVEGADLFVEAPDGLYIALPERTSLGDQGRMRFRIDLTKGEDPKLLRGKELRLTFVGVNSRSQMRWRVPMS